MTCRPTNSCLSGPFGSIFRALLGPCLLLFTACAAPPTSHPVEKATLASVTLEQLEAHLDEPGPIEFSHHRAADWQVALSGLLNLDHPKSQAAGLQDRPEPIFIDFFELKHPSKGTFLVDSGVREDFAVWADEQVPWLASLALNLDKLKPRVSTAQWLAKHEAPRAVLLTHLHLDHILGVPDLPQSTQLYVGPQEATLPSIKSGMAAGLTDQLLANKPALIELQASTAAPAIDLLGDGSLWAIYAPGHTPGSLAYVARTTQGAVLMTGDVCHTSFGFENSVEPGSFTEDHAANQQSLQMLRDLAQRHPQMRVFLGHQDTQ